MRRNLLLAMGLALLAACGSTAEPDPGEAGDRSSYPQGPYGTRAGATIADLAFDLPDGTPFHLGDIFADARNRVLLLNSMAGWCVPCLEEQQHLAKLHRDFAARGLVVVAAMFENGEYATPTLEQVASWKDHYELPYILVRDADYVLRPYYSGDPPMNMVIDVDEMKILYVGAGYEDAVIRSLVDQNLPKAP